MSEKPEEPSPERPSHTQLFDWRDGKPYRWKEGFPLKPVLKKRGPTLGELKKVEPPDEA